MANEEKSQTKTPSTPTAVAARPAVGNSVRLDDEQFRKLQRTLVLGMVMAGLVMNRPNVTPTVKNLETVLDLANAALEMV